MCQQHSRSNWNLVVLVFGEREKLDNLEKKLLEGASKITNNKLNPHMTVNAQQKVRALTKVFLHQFDSSIISFCTSVEFTTSIISCKDTLVYTHASFYFSHLSSLKYTGATRRCSWYESFLTLAHTATKGTLSNKLKIIKTYY